jgi:hypothetical protein
MKERVRLHLSPIGGAVAAVCFFMPWASCHSYSVSAADTGGSAWLLFAAAIGIVVSFLYCRIRGDVASAKPIVLVCSITGIALVVAGFVRLHNRLIGKFFGIRYGGVLALLGFALALFGTRYLGRADTPAGPPPCATR